LQLKSRDKKYIDLIRNTWEPLFCKKEVLSDDWINNRKVLIGSGA
jgi:hypothetical protein